MTELNQHLADAVAWWTQRHALSQTVIAARGGPSTSSMTKISAGRGSVRPGSLTALDVGLGWGDGVAAQYLAGLDPLGIEAASPAPLEEWTDAQLLRELGRRLQSRSQEDETDGVPKAREKTGEGAPAPVTQIYSPKGERMIREAQQIERAADDRDDET